MPSGMQRLSEEAVRAKVIELFDSMNEVRMNMWLVSGVANGVLDPSITENIMAEEIFRRSHTVQMYWLGTCNCKGQMN